MFRRIKPLLVLVALVALTGQANAACWQWSQTAANNASADPSINFAEGMSPSSVNDSARAMMARLAECRDDLSGFLVTGGTATAYTLATNQGLNTIPNDGQALAFTMNVTNGTAATLTVDAGTTYPLQTAPSVAVNAGVLTAGTPYKVKFSLADSAWILQDFYATTIVLADGSVAYRKIQQPSSTSRLLGTPSIAAQAISLAANNGSGLVRITVADTTGYNTGDKKSVSAIVGTIEANGYWTITVVDATHIDLQGSAFVNAYVSGGTIGGFVEEIVPGVGLTMVGNTLAAPAAPPVSSFSGLSIKVASNTTVAAVASFVSMSDGTNVLTRPLSGTINLGTAGVVNARDSGTIAIDTWYAIWAIAMPDGTTAGLASASFTNPTLPTGYTFKARIGAVQTVHATAQLYGTWQLGRRAQYVVGLAQTTQPPVIAAALSAQGTFSSTSPVLTGLSVARFVPPTASMINVLSFNSYKNAGIAAVLIAPNAAYGGANNGPTGTNGLIFPVFLGSNGTVENPSLVWMTLESTSIFWATAGITPTGAAVACMGWEDNL